MQQGCIGQTGLHVLSLRREIAIKYSHDSNEMAVSLIKWKGYSGGVVRQQA